jgi:hypothetical protein
MVMYETSDGQPGYHQVDELTGAITYVEQLRNDDGVERARIFRMEEVTFEFRPYYRVELGDTDLADHATDHETATVEDAHEDVTEDVHDDVHEDVTVEASEHFAVAADPQPDAAVAESVGDSGVGTDPAMPSDPSFVGEPAVGGSNGTVRRGLFGR